MTGRDHILSVLSKGVEWDAIILARDGLFAKQWKSELFHEERMYDIVRYNGYDENGEP